MKIGQLIEYNMSKIFVEKSNANVVEKLFPDPFEKKKNYLLINCLKFYRGFMLHGSLRAIEVY